MKNVKRLDFLVENVSSEVWEYVNTDAKHPHFLFETKGFTTNLYELVPFEDLSIDFRHSLVKDERRGSVVLSPNRADHDRETNTAALNKLLTAVTATKFQWLTLFASYLERNHKTDQEKRVYDKLLVIFNHDRDKNIIEDSNLSNHALMWSQQAPENPLLLMPPGNQSAEKLITRFAEELLADKILLMDGDTSGANSYQYEGLLINPPPCTYNERYSRYLKNEMFLSRMREV